MDFRSHLARPFDLRLWSNRIILLLVLAAALVAGVSWLARSDTAVLLAPLQLFAIWALTREIDPDHTWTAFVAGIAAGVWVLLGQAGPSLLAVGGLAVAARIVANTTGRRPLNTDVIVVTAGAVAISFSLQGWVAGFGLAVALFIDARFRGEKGMLRSWSIAIAALGSTVVATAARALPVTAVVDSPLAAAGAALVALILILRLPAEPSSLVDARYEAKLELHRVHAARTLVGVAVVAISLIAPGGETVPLLATLALVIAGNEAELRSRALQ